MTESDLPAGLPGFDEPLALLRACHARILEHCDLLERIVALPEADSRNADTSSAVRKVIRYFSTSAPLHHQDEESDLFPQLARQSLKLADLIHSLKRDHQELDALWAEIEAELKQFPNIADRAAFAEKAGRYCRLSREHVTRENMDFLPLAESSLSSRQLKDIGATMAARRGVGYSGLSR